MEPVSLPWRGGAIQISGTMVVVPLSQSHLSRSIPEYFTVLSMVEPFTGSPVGYVGSQEFLSAVLLGESTSQVPSKAGGMAPSQTVIEASWDCPDVQAKPLGLAVYSAGVKMLWYWVGGMTEYRYPSSHSPKSFSNASHPRLSSGYPSLHCCTSTEAQGEWLQMKILWSGPLKKVALSLSGR